MTAAVEQVRQEFVSWKAASWTPHWHLWDGVTTCCGVTVPPTHTTSIQVDGAKICTSCVRALEAQRD